MRFHAILVTRDASDVIAESLDAKLQWADQIYVYDTGSTDQTWDIVHDFAQKDKRVIPYRREAIVFCEGVRAYVFEAFRHRFEPGDWIVKSDEDEFFHISPRDFVAERLTSLESAVWTQTYEFRLTHDEAAIQSEAGAVRAERCSPLVGRRRYYVPLEYSEHRMCRYREHMKWYPTDSFPVNAGVVARARIPMRHYPHRDIVQLEQRVRLREEIARHLPSSTYPHWKCTTWREFCVPHDLKDLHYWPIGQDLPMISSITHLPSAPKRLLQFTAHRLVVPWLDWLRRPFPRNAQPQSIADIATARAGSSK